MSFNLDSSCFRMRTYNQFLNQRLCQRTFRTIHKLRRSEI